MIACKWVWQYQCGMQLCYWHNKTILLLSMYVCVLVRETVLLCSMLCIIELALAHAHEAHAEKLYFSFSYFDFNSSVSRWVYNRSHVTVSVFNGWPEVLSVFGHAIPRKSTQVVILEYGYFDVGQIIHQISTYTITCSFMAAISGLIIGTIYQKSCRYKG